MCNWQKVSTCVTTAKANKSWNIDMQMQKIRFKKWVRSPKWVRIFFPAYFRLSPLQKHVRKVVGGFGKKSCVGTGVRKRGNTCVTDRHDMTSAVKVALNPNTTNQPNASQSIWIIFYDKRVLNPFPNKPWSLHVYSASLLKTLWEIARYEQFLLFQLYFLPIWRTFCHIHQIWNCCLQTLPVWKSLELVVWERLLNASPRCIYTKEVIG